MFVGEGGEGGEGGVGGGGGGVDPSAIDPFVLAFFLQYKSSE